MANTKWTAASLVATVLETDQILKITDPGGTPASERLTVATLLGRAVGEMYITGGSGTQTISAATETKIDQFDANGASLNTTPDHTNDRIQTDGTGFFLALWRVAFDSNTAADQTEFWVRWNSTNQNQTRSGMEASASLRTQQSGWGIVDVTAASQYFELYCEVDTGGGNVDIVEASLLVMKLFET